TLIGGTAALSQRVENQLKEYNPKRLQGADRYTTAVKVSREYKTSEVVLLATGQDYPDALTSTVLARKKNAPLLLTPSKTLPKEVEKEIERLGAKKVIIIGGEAAVSNGIQNKLANKLGKANISRISGATRYETAVKIGKEVRAITGQNKEAILVDGTNFPDAIVMTSMGVEKDMPILLTQPSKLNASTEKALKEWKAEKVTIGGGEVAVSNAVQKQLEKTMKTTRISGADRYHTSVKVAKATYENPNHVVVARGDMFPDAIVGAPYAAKNKYPIVLSRPTEVPKVV
ncbi:cell wall-binding repeat-containing protein, partial [Miniphocaeibacter massiliensis]|uniref:cell wall-binding repeat-containing protein n=1 Tax=Miniphocaeibacter massiliensis TaxID=2041841 RepID=UPI00101AE5B2